MNKYIWAIFQLEVNEVDFKFRIVKCLDRVGGRGRVGRELSYMRGGGYYETGFDKRNTLNKDEKIENYFFYVSLNSFKNLGLEGK